MFPTCDSGIAPGCSPLPEPRIGHQGVPEQPGWSWKQLPDEFLWKNFGVYQQWRSFPLLVLRFIPQNVAPKSQDRTQPHHNHGLAPAAAGGRGGLVGIFGGFSLFPEGSRDTAGAESHPGGSFPHLCSTSSSAWAGKSRAPWGQSLCPPSEISLPRHDLTHFPIKKGFFTQWQGTENFVFPPSKPERMIVNPQTWYGEFQTGAMLIEPGD